LYCWYMYSQGAPGLRDMLCHMLNSWIVLSRATSMHSGSGCRCSNRPSEIVSNVPYTPHVTTRMSASGLRYGVALGKTGAGAAGESTCRSSSQSAYSCRDLAIVSEFDLPASNGRAQRRKMVFTRSLNRVRGGETAGGATGSDSRSCPQYPSSSRWQSAYRPSSHASLTDESVFVNWRTSSAEKDCASISTSSIHSLQESAGLTPPPASLLF